MRRDAIEKAVESYRCPVCHSATCEFVYYNESGEIVGCDDCLVTKSVADVVYDEFQTYMEREIDRQIDERLGK